MERIDRTYSTDVKSGDDKVKVSGWVHEIRDIGKLVFIVIRDRKGKIQATFKEDECGEELFKEVKNLGKESVVEITGSVEENGQAPGGREVKPDEMVVLSEAETPLPLEVSGSVDSDLSTRLDERFIDLRKKEEFDIFSFRSKVVSGLRDYFESEEFVEIHTPIISKGGAEGGATLFPVIYYQEEAFLRQSPQLYKQMLMAAGFDKVFEIGPSFRAEKFGTSRHVSEFTQWDVEMAFIEDQNDVMDHLEKGLKHLIGYLKENASRELEDLGIELKEPDYDFPRIKFDEAIDILEKEYDHVPEDPTDLDTKGEKLLGKYFEEKGKEFFFVVGYPGEKFYYMQGREEDDMASRKFDLIYRGQELSSGGQREHRIDVLHKAMEEEGMDKSNFEFFLQIFKYGIPPHGGFGLGVDRLVTKLLELDNIKEGIMFPRDPNRLSP